MNQIMARIQQEKLNLSDSIRLYELKMFDDLMAKLLNCDGLNGSNLGVLPGRHFILFPNNHNLSPDGYSSSFTPPHPFVHRMWLGGKMKFQKPLEINLNLNLFSSCESAEMRETSRGQALVTRLKNTITTNGVTVMEEYRNLIYLSRPLINSSRLGSFKPVNYLAFTPTRTDLHQFSILTHNKHKIHLDRDYTTKVEGYRDLVVQGPLITTAMLDYIRFTFNSAITQFEYKCVAPCFVGEEIKLTGSKIGDTVKIWGLVGNSLVAKGVAKVVKQPGLAHTLEHLIFCGSATHTRGYLDTLAVRSLSTGTNAYTTVDHTAYEITTVGIEGMKTLIPVFLNHILNPTLSESQFLTEVYHVDPRGKSQGVVYCEMASRENTEADLLDLELRRELYQSQTYAFECGGLTGDIEHLSNEQVRDYHSKFYKSGNITVLVCGDGVEAVIKELEKYPELLRDGKDTGVVDSSTVLLQPQPALPNFTTITKKFPSDDFEVGSIGYTWPGPPSDDIKTITALEVIHRFFNDNPSSLFRQGFVERAEPWASDVDMDVGDHVDANLTWIFSGVPRPEDDSGSGGKVEGENDDEDCSDSIDSNSDNDSDSSASNSNTSMISDTPKDLFAPGIYHFRIMSLLREFISQEYELDMSQTLKRHAQKMAESFEESPHESFAAAIVPDVVRFHLLEKTDGAIKKVGLRLAMFEVLKELEGEGAQFWKALVKKYFIDQHAREVMMVPDAQLAEDLAQRQKTNEDNRVRDLGKAGLAKIAKRIAKAIDDNKIDLDDETMASMPPVPSAALAGSIPSKVANINLSEAGSIFGASQVVKTETAFIHFGLALSIAKLPKRLRPYLVLFQELLFQSPLELRTESGSKVIMQYEEVSTHSSKLFISHECGVGFGNSYFSASYLTQVLTIFVTGVPGDWEVVVRFVTQVLLFSQFIKKRIISIAKNLLSSIVDVKRDGNGVLDATINRVCLSNEYAEKCGSNENAISIFEQEVFLKSVIEMCKNGNEDQVTKDLNELRHFIVTSKTSEPSFVRVGVPMQFSVLQTNLATPSTEITNDFLRVWESEYCKYTVAKIKGNKRKEIDIKKTFAFPFPRIPFRMDQMDLKFSKSIIVPVSGLSTSYLSQFIPCDLLQSPKNPDYFPTVLLAEILSRTEGPLYDGVRGKGFAYGVSLSCYLWSGQLSFELYRSSEPEKGLAVFHSILKELFTDEGFEKYCGKYDVETAKASVSYRWAANCSTASSVISTALRSSLQGFTDLNEYVGFIAQLDLVTTEDLKRVLNKYYSLFLGEKVTIVVAPPSDCEKIRKTMGTEFVINSLEEFTS